MTPEIKLIIRQRGDSIEIIPPRGVRLLIDAGAQDHGDMHTISEAAERYGVSKNTLAKACDYGNIASEVRGGLRFVRDSDVEEWIKTPRRPGRKKKAVE